MASLFVIDIQRTLVDQSPHGKRVTDATTAILEKARTAIDEKTPGSTLKEIVFVQHHDTSPEEGNLLIGSPEWELVFPPRDSHPSEFLVSKTDGAERYLPQSWNSVLTFGRRKYIPF